MDAPPPQPSRCSGVRILSDVLNSLPVQKRIRHSARWEAMPTAVPPG
ncbi:hypothetical protein HMPREF0733_11314 [Rothia dentocariosa ATCC 17931]|uniref:Uncharacterized protein n=1 Tax=Rothia dentocariosa (strain ATCC 17931 / CDC X599 / XDIA) TaxID=762948 RepID=E3H568_ROTDC|nr:hypothetical protein HMPREF0733_11314 [Rothia dentocariosa ATCC 17931]